MNVVFHEDIMYCLSEPEFQRDYNEEEIHTFTYLPLEEDQSFIKVVNLQDTRKENGDDSRAETSEDIFREDTFREQKNSDTTTIENKSHEEPHEEISNQSSVENVPTTNPSLIRRILPRCQNRGIYIPTVNPDLSSRVKYHMSHFMFNHRLSESN